MQTSSEGIEFLERHEGVVLKAYRDPVGILTIGAGLTKASGVIDPRPGMQITKKEASRLLALALGQNYEPRVRKAMPSANQQEFDGAVSFDWNTGAIHKASWVRSWRADDWLGVKARLARWKKGGGRVLPGLVRRRAEEYDVMRHGNYGVRVVAKVPNPKSTMASWALPVNAEEIVGIRGGFNALGYPPGEDGRGVRKAAVMQFQKDHDLTTDGIIGRATLSTLQRMLNARQRAKETAQGAAVGAGGTGAAQAAGALTEAQLWLIGGGVLAVALLAVGYLAWTYRDAVAAKLHHKHPKLASKIREY